MKEDEVNCDTLKEVEESIDEFKEGSSEPNEKDDITSSGSGLGCPVQFKKPLLLVGPRKGVHKFKQIRVPNLPTTEEENTFNANTTTDEDAEEKKHNSEPSLKPNIPAFFSSLSQSTNEKMSVPYKEPSWAGLASDSYSFEVLKSGTIVERINLNTKSYYVFGRLTNCDILMANPTASRFHAVLQYRAYGDADHPVGFYIYDLGSSHGTFLNKNRVKPNMYVRMQVGHMLKLGKSTRNFILQGPENDIEPESELSVTEIKELQRQRKLAAMLEQKKQLNAEAIEETRRKEKEEEDGINWGMGEDADEETDLAENPFASTQNEELYINDPKKTLRGWFEREGYELQYNCEEKGFGQFICRVELPITNSRDVPIVAEAIVRGKKKESVVQCALEACRILDQHGLLRQSNHESKKRKAKNWEEDDYYDSDDDTFLDRTGTIEKKRQIRMEQAGVKGTTETHTYQSLVERHQKILEDIKKIEAELAESTRKKEEEKQAEDDNEDALDAYMSSLSSSSKSDKKHISKLKGQLTNLRIEEAQVRNLANIAKPTEMPKLNPPPQSSNLASKQKLPIIGKRKIAVIKSKVLPSQTTRPTVENDSEEEEVESD